MPDLSAQLDGAVGWLRGNAVQLLLVAVLLLIAYRGLRPWIHSALIRVMGAKPLAGGDPTEQAEVDRRVATLEDLFTKLLRALVIGAMVAVALGIFDLWPLVTGLGLVLAALTLAGQSIILDYLMGILILLEGQYSKGDTVQLGGIEGVVEEVGLRRTTVRDMRGTLHSISNGQIRQSANLTRTYATATVEIDGVSDADVEAVIEVLDEVGAGLAEDPEFDGMFHDVPCYTGTTRLTANGATLRMSGRVRPEARVRVEAEMRRRVAAGLAAREIELIRSAAYPPR